MCRVEIACLYRVDVPVTQERGGSTTGPREQQEGRLGSSFTHHHPLHPTPRSPRKKVSSPLPATDGKETETLLQRSHRPSPCQRGPGDSPRCQPSPAPRTGRDGPDRPKHLSPQIVQISQGLGAEGSKERKKRLPEPVPAPFQQDIQGTSPGPSPRTPTL